MEWAQHWSESSLSVPLVWEGGSGLVPAEQGGRGAAAPLAGRGRGRGRGGRGGREGLVHQHLVRQRAQLRQRGGSARPVLGRPVRAEHLLVGNKGFVTFIKRDKLLKNVFLVLKVFLDCLEDGLWILVLRHNVALLLILLDQLLYG